MHRKSRLGKEIVSVFLVNVVIKYTKSKFTYSEVLDGYKASIVYTAYRIIILKTFDVKALLNFMVSEPSMCVFSVSTVCANVQLQWETLVPPKCENFFYFYSLTIFTAMQCHMLNFKPNPNTHVYTLQAKQHLLHATKFFVFDLRCEMFYVVTLPPL